MRKNRCGLRVMKHNRRQEKWQAQVSLTWHYLVMDIVVKVQFKLKRTGLKNEL